MGVEDKRVNDLEWSVADVKQAIKLLTQLTLRANEWMESLAVAQAASERKIAELAAAQIRTEEAVRRLSNTLETLAGGAGQDPAASEVERSNSSTACRSLDE